MKGKILCPKSVEVVFQKFNGRRDALIKALTTEFDEFFKQCDPVGSGRSRFLLSTLPEPAMGINCINFARDMMQEEDWVALVSVQSDAWLVSVAHYESAMDGFPQSGRIELFKMINELPTVFETVFDTRRKQRMENASRSNKGRNVSMSSTEAECRTLQRLQGKKAKKVDEQAAATEEEGGDDRVFCGCCVQKYTSDQLWMCCQFCEKSYHGRCVKISPALAEHIIRYKCPSCCDPKKQSGP